MDLSPATFDEARFALFDDPVLRGIDDAQLKALMLQRYLGGPE